MYTRARQFLATIDTVVCSNMIKREAAGHTPCKWNTSKFYDKVILGATISHHTIIVIKDVIKISSCVPREVAELLKYKIAYTSNPSQL